MAHTIAMSGTNSCDGVELTTDLLREVGFCHFNKAEVVEAIARVKRSLVSLHLNLWSLWLQKAIGTSGPHSFSATAEDVVLLAFASAGRIVVTLHRADDPGRFVSVVGAQTGNDPIGLYGIHMTDEAAVALIRSANQLSVILKKSFAPTPKCF